MAVAASQHEDVAFAAERRGTDRIRFGHLSDVWAMMCVRAVGEHTAVGSHTCGISRPLSPHVPISDTHTHIHQYTRTHTYQCDTRARAHTFATTSPAFEVLMKFDITGVRFRAPEGVA